jgi:arabinose-5-phosphate isomerase
MQDIKSYAIRCFQDEAQAILDLIPRLDDNFTKAVEMIFNCKGKVIVTGVGKSGHVGEKMASTLASLGTPSFFLNPLDAFHGDLGMISEGDVVISISYSGYTDELLRFIPMLMERNIPIIGITGNKNSLLAQYSSCHLDIKVDHEADPLNLAPTSSTMATMAMGDALACALVKLRNFKACDFAQFHPGGSLGKRLLSRARDYMVKENLPIVTPDTKVFDAIITASNGKLGLAIVIDEKGVLIGIITDGDVRRAVQKYQNKMFDLTVKDIMTPNPKTVRPETTLNEVDRILRKYNIHALVVTDKDGAVVGVIDSFRVI